MLLLLSVSSPSDLDSVINPLYFFLWQMSHISLFHGNYSLHKSLFRFWDCRKVSISYIGGILPWFPFSFRMLFLVSWVFMSTIYVVLPNIWHVYVNWYMRYHKWMKNMVWYIFENSEKNVNLYIQKDRYRQLLLRSIYVLHHIDILWLCSALIYWQTFCPYLC